MTKPSSYQRPQHSLRVGERVKLAGVPETLLASLPQPDAEALRAIIGKVVPVMGFNAQGDVEIEFRAKDSILHTVWVPVRCLKPLPGRSRK